MKKQKSIIIKHPILRNLRNSLRTIIFAAVYGKASKIREETRKLEHIDKYRDGKPRIEEEKEFQMKYEELGISRYVYVIFIMNMIMIWFSFLSLASGFVFNVILLIMTFGWKILRLEKNKRDY